MSLNGQVIGQTHYATRALLERELARLGVSFHQSVALNAAAAEGGSTIRAHLVARMTGTLKLDESTVHTVLDGLATADLLRPHPSDASTLTLTDAGRAAQRGVADAVADITERLYAEIPDADLAAAGRVLTLVRQRADRELAATGS
ncbi:MarR family winged helix-turn-helix transcriptional regulator [Micromonospora sp. URMC 103]|uniref:MarR family winged helix-turn-helix transcriptional regulator n=1 Tax=Micromonospora sp. URMC 103 TaxID=3423406 RepID=UPI003F1AF5DB